MCRYRITSAGRLTGAQQTGMSEVENRPKDPKTILDRCADERDLSVGDEFLDGARLLGARILDCLCLVDDRYPPLCARQPVEP
jgi:hypothetical protein